VCLAADHRFAVESWNIVVGIIGGPVMKMFAAALFIFASLLTIHFALGAGITDRPAGVAAQDWIAVSDKLGFVVIPPDARVFGTPDRQPLLLTPAAAGISWRVPIMVGSV
jgi:hypothetical protein